MTNHILVVDDDEDVQFVVTEVLKEGGYDVRAVKCGRAALAAVSQDKPCLILMDLRLPDLSGKQVAEMLLASDQAIPILMFSAGKPDAEWSTRLGVVGWLAKPFDLDDLLEAVEPYCPQTIAPSPN
jgi:CheY-like chemotaxis protein